MAGSKVAGVSVLVKVGTTVVGGQTGASLTRGADTIETTSKDSNGWAEAIASIKSWSIDCEGFVVLSDAGQDALEDAYDAGTLVAVEVTFGGQKYSGSALVTELTNEFPQDDAVTYSVSLEGSGALTRATAA